jgi:hypothetical protein
MRRKKHISVWLSVLALAATAVGCGDSWTCPLNNTVYTTYAFYADSLEYGDTIKYPITCLDTLTVTAAGTDSVLLNKGYNLSTFDLPMSYDAAVDTLYFRFCGEEWEATDTVWVDKIDIAHFENPDCATSMWHTITGVGSTHHVIRNIAIVNPNVNYDQNTTFQVYLRSTVE